MLGVQPFSSARAPRRAHSAPNPPVLAGKGTLIAKASAAISGHADTRTAALEVAEWVEGGLAGAQAKALIVLASFHHARSLNLAIETLQAHLKPEALIGGTAQTVFAGVDVPERRSGLAAFAIGGPDVHARAFALDWERGPAELTTPNHWRTLAHTGEDHAATFLLADPFSTAPAPVLSNVSTAIGGPIGGGLLSGSTLPSGNTLVANEVQTHTGLVGIGIGGNLRCEMLLSRACRPIGEPLLVTAAAHDRILGLGGRPAAAVAREAILGLSETERQLVSDGLRLGIAASEFRDRFSPPDFLIREIVGVDEKTGALQINERPIIGRTVQFHVLDLDVARNDLDLALEAQLLETEPPIGILMAESGLRDVGSEDLAQIRQRLGAVPTAGFVAAGEFGPFNEQAVLQGGCASAMIFRQNDR